MRDAVGALKNITEYPKVRKASAAYFRAAGAEPRFEEIFEKPMYDSKQWPASSRYEHQNVAPGGLATDDEAAARERWGYPAPFRAG